MWSAFWAPDFSRPFALAIDASQIGTGAELTEPDEKQVNNPICYFSKKYTTAQKKKKKDNKKIKTIFK